VLGSLKTCVHLLDRRERWRWAGLIPLIVAGALMEAMGAAGVFVLIKLIADPSQMSSLPLLSRLAAHLPWHDDKTIVLGATLVIASYYLLKNAALALIAAHQNRVVGESVARLSREMLKGYLSLPFAFHLRRNSAELIRNATESVDRVFRMVMASLVTAVAEALVVAGIVAVLLATAPLLALTVVVALLSLLVVVIRSTRRVLLQWGREDAQLRAASLKTLQQALAGVKEVKVRGCEPFYFGRFWAEERALVRARARYETVSMASRLLIEAVFVCGLLLVITLATLRGKGPDLVPLLGLYAYAGFRIIPSLNRILMYVSSIRYGAGAVEPVHEDLQLFRRHSADKPAVLDGQTLSFADRLVLDRVSYQYEGAATPALEDVSLAIRPGDSIGVVGPTGAGKSTLIDIVLGLLVPSRGRITADGVDIFAALSTWQSKIGYVPQAVHLTDDTLRRNIAFGFEDTRIEEDKVRSAVRMAQLDGLVDGLPRGLDTVVGERGVRLSGGERQRVAIARALYHQPQLLVFDEATSSLDAQTERELTHAIESLHGQKTLIIIAHRLSTVRRCDRLVFLRQGRIADVGSFDELLERSVAFREMVAAALDGGDSATPPARLIAT